MARVRLFRTEEFVHLFVLPQSALPRRTLICLCNGSNRAVVIAAATVVNGGWKFDSMLWIFEIFAVVCNKKRKKEWKKKKNINPLFYCLLLLFPYSPSFSGKEHVHIAHYCSIIFFFFWSIQPNTRMYKWPAIFYFFFFSSGFSLVLFHCRNKARKKTSRNCYYLFIKNWNFCFPLARLQLFGLVPSMAFMSASPFWSVYAIVRLCGCVYAWQQIEYYLWNSDMHGHKQ